LYGALSVKMLGPKPYYSLTSTSFMHMCVNNLLWNKLSKDLWERS